MNSLINNFINQNKTTTEMEVLVFSTSIRNDRDVGIISEELNHLSGILDWSVDLEDWEKVLRVEGINLCSSDIKKCLLEHGIIACKMPTD